MKNKLLTKIKALALVGCILLTLVPSTAFKADVKTGGNVSADEVTAETLVEHTYATVIQEWEKDGKKVVYGKDYVIDPVLTTNTGTVVDAANSKGYNNSVLQMETNDTLEI